MLSIPYLLFGLMFQLVFYGSMLTVWSIVHILLWPLFIFLWLSYWGLMLALIIVAVSVLDHLINGGGYRRRVYRHVSFTRFR